MATRKRKKKSWKKWKNANQKELKTEMTSTAAQ